MVFHEDAQVVAREIGVSSNAVYDSLAVLQAIKDRNWDKLKSLYSNGHPGVNVLEWACTRVRGAVPTDVYEYCKTTAKETNKKYKERKSRTDVKVKAEPKPEPDTTTNDVLAVVKVLESLKALIQGQAALLDAITTGQGELLDALKALACDLKDNNNANTDLVCQRLKECGDTLSGIKMNTRKKGL